MVYPVDTPMTNFFLDPMLLVSAFREEQIGDSTDRVRAPDQTSRQAQAAFTCGLRSAAPPCTFCSGGLDQVQRNV